MSTPIKLIAQGLDVADIHWRLLSNPQLWNEHTARTADPDSPHHGLDDIWARFGSPEYAESGQAHSAEWYPSAEILGIKPLCEAVMGFVKGEELGGVLITRIPPGVQCRPHQDHGWHASYYQKFAVQITSAPGQRFCFDEETLETRPGDLFWFDNQFTHWVINPTAYERITLIICIRV